MDPTGLIVIYTDGACHGNPGPGGWGVLLDAGGQTREIYGGDPATTNNRMELTAAIRALEAIGDRGVAVQIWTDSTYVRSGITSWVAGWKRNGWLTSSRQPVKNVDLWKQLDQLAGRLDVEWRWVRGHAGNEGNEKADQLATRGAVENGRSTGAPRRPAPASQQRRRRPRYR